MSDPTKSASGGDSDTSGAQDGDKSPEPKNDVEALKAKNAQLLKEKRDVQKRLDALEASKRETEEKALKDKEDFKTLAEQRAEELATAKKQIADYEESTRNRTKLASFLDAVQGTIDKKYWGLIDLEKIVMNQDTGEVDGSSVAKVVDAFKKEHPVLIQTRKSDGMPKDAPQGGSGALSYEAWMKLPYAEKIKRRHEVK